MTIDLNFFVTDLETGAAIPNAVVLCYGSIIPPQFNSRYTQGDGGCNFYHGPPLQSDVPISVLVIPPPNYGPYTSTDQPVMFGTQSLSVALKLKSFKLPFTPAPHAWMGNFCGTRVSGLPAVPGYSPRAPELVMSWFYPFYDANVRAQIIASWKARGYVDQIASWPDCRARGFTPQMFAESLKEWIKDGIRPCVMLTSKDFDLSSDSPTGANVPQIIADLQPVLKVLVGLIPRVCVGWELNLWLSPQDVQDLTDALMPPFVAAKCKTYVHFFGYMSFPIAGDNAVYWIANVGKLIGVLNERSPRRNPTSDSYVDFIEDCLERFAGNDNMPSDNGIDGKPFDFIALEITASDQYAGDMTEAQGDVCGSAAVNAPPKHGPAGVVGCMGSGNGIAS